MLTVLIYVYAVFLLTSSTWYYNVFGWFLLESIIYKMYIASLHDVCLQTCMSLNSVVTFRISVFMSLQTRFYHASFAIQNVIVISPLCSLHTICLICEALFLLRHKILPVKHIVLHLNTITLFTNKLLIGEVANLYAYRCLLKLAWPYQYYVYICGNSVSKSLKFYSFMFFLFLLTIVWCIYQDRGAYSSRVSGLTTLVYAHVLT